MLAIFFLTRQQKRQNGKFLPNLTIPITPETRNVNRQRSRKDTSCELPARKVFYLTKIRENVTNCRYSTGNGFL